MSMHRSRAAHFAILGVIGALSVLSATASRADEPYSDIPCSVGKNPGGPCLADLVPAHHAVATIPGKTPLQPLQADDGTPPARPWLRAGN